MIKERMFSVIDSLRNKFHHELPQRLSYLNAHCDDACLDCECERFALTRRLIDIFKLLGYRQIDQLEMDFYEAEAFYKQHKQAVNLKLFINNISSMVKNLTLDDYREINLFVSKKTEDDESLGQIYLYAEGEKYIYLEQLLREKKYQVFRISNQLDINVQIPEKAEGIFVIDDDYQSNAYSSIEKFRQLKKNNNYKLEYILVSKGADFDKRLIAVRENIKLVSDIDKDSVGLLHAIEQITLKTFKVEKRVLFICTDQVLSEYMSALLSSTDLKITLVNDFEKNLIDILKKQSFDLIIIDYFLNDIYGYEISEIIKQYDNYAFVPIHFLFYQTDLECDDHAEMLTRYGQVVTVYEPQAIVKKIFEAISYAFDAYKLGQYMSGALRESENRRIALDTHCIVSITDVTGKILDVNHKFCEVTRYSREELVGETHSILNSKHHPRSFFINMWKVISSGKVWQGEICNKRKDGTLYWVESSIVPFLNEHGMPYQYVSIRTEITHIKETEERLRISEDRLMRGQRFANMGSWDWNIKTDELYWSPKITELFGYKEGELETAYENFINSIHEDDRENVVNAINDCVEKGRGYDIEHRVVWPNGDIHWLLGQGDVVRTDDGAPLRMLGIVQDITERKKVEFEVSKQKDLLTFLKDGLTGFVDEKDFNFVAGFVLGELLKITESEYGFVGEIVYDGIRPYLKMHAVNNLAWDDSTCSMYYEKCREGLEIHDLDNLMSTVILDKKTVINNALKNDPAVKDLPKGHFEINNFMGVPVFYGGDVVGVYGLANKKSGYSQSDVDFLKPFNATYSAIIHAKIMSELQQEMLFESRASKLKAERANDAKSQFLSNMSHELRTPMNAILGFGQLLSMSIGQELSDVQQDNVNEILKAGHHLLGLINEILDLSRIEAGKTDLNIEHVLILDVIIELMGLMMPQYSEAGITVETSIGGKACELSQLDSKGIKVYADPSRLRQILINLISNAIKYNRQNGKIYIDVEVRENNIIRLKITDTGIGIPRDKQKEIFQSFHRLGAEMTDIEGTGIGLVITKKLIEFMGGTIGFESEHGVGSCFWVDMLRCNEEASLTEENNTINMDMAAVKDDKIVIYIEDNAANMRLMVQLMSSFEHIKLITAHEPQLGLKLIEQHAPDLILLDINLPGMSGIEILGELRKKSKTKMTPVIAISANAMSSDVKKAMDAGFNEYITKPIEIHEVIEVLNNYLA